MSLGYGSLKSIVSTYNNYYLFGQAIIDKVVIMSDIPNKFTFHFDGEENLKEIVAQNKGGLLLSSHIGNWEIAGHLLNRLETRINLVMFDAEHEQIREYLSSVTGGRKLNVILIKDDLSHIYEINDAFLKNELICMHSDRFIKGNKTLVGRIPGQPRDVPRRSLCSCLHIQSPCVLCLCHERNKISLSFFCLQGDGLRGAEQGCGHEGHAC